MSEDKLLDDSFIDNAVAHYLKAIREDGHVLVRHVKTIGIDGTARVTIETRNPSAQQNYICDEFLRSSTKLPPSERSEVLARIASYGTGRYRLSEEELKHDG